VFNIYPYGLELKGTITHNGVEPIYSYNENKYYVKRALYIDNVLYTISEAKVKMNNLDDLSEINEIQLP